MCRARPGHLTGPAPRPNVGCTGPVCSGDKLPMATVSPRARPWARGRVVLQNHMTESVLHPPRPRERCTSTRSQ